MRSKLKPKYGQTALYILLLAAVVILMGGTRRCNSASRLAPVANGGSQGDTLDVAIVYGPMSYFLYGDTLGGLNFDLLTLFGRSTGHHVKFWPVVSLDDAMTRLENGHYDILASLPLDNSVRSRFATTGSIFLDRLVLVQLADSFGIAPVTSALDLGADTIYLQKDSPALMRIQNLSAETGIDIPVNQSSGLSEEYLCMKVAAGDVKLAVVNEKTAAKMKETYPLLSYDSPVSFTQFQVWIMNPADTLLVNGLNTWLDSVKTTPAFKSLLKRYS